MQSKIKKFSFISYLIIAALFFLGLPMPLAAQSTEQITITTYYPSPYGVYQNLRVVDNIDLESGATFSVNGSDVMRLTNSGIYFDRPVYINGKDLNSALTLAELWDRELQRQIGVVRMVLLGIEAAALIMAIPGVGPSLAAVAMSAAILGSITLLDAMVSGLSGVPDWW